MFPLQYSSTSSAIQLKAKFGRGKVDASTNNNNLSLSDTPYAFSNECKQKEAWANNSINAKSKKQTMAKTNKIGSQTPTSSGKGVGIGLKWEKQHLL